MLFRSVNTNVGHHTEVPLIAFFGLKHLRIALTVSVLDRGRGGNQGGIDDNAFLEQQTTTGQMLVDRFKQPRPLSKLSTRRSPAIHE